MDEDSPERPLAKPRRVIPPERLEMAQKLYLTGVPDHRARERLCREFEVTEKSARKYMRLAKERIGQLPTATPEAIRARAEAMLLNAYETAEGKVGPTGMANPDCGSMVAASYRIAELHGAAAPKRLDVTSGGEKLGSMTDDELRARLAELDALDAERAAR